MNLYEDIYLHSSDPLRNVLLLKISVISYIKTTIYSLDSQFPVLTQGFLDYLHLFPVILPLDFKFFREETIFLYFVCTVPFTMGFQSRTSRCSNNENNFESKSQNVSYFTETLYKIMIV